MFETLIFLAALFVGGIVLAVIALKALVLFFKIGFWALALPFKILLGIGAGLFSILFAIIVPILVVIGIVGLAVTLPLLLVFAIP
ncbi:hypothetical protein MYX84_16175, partial [Acidobacteria bacterium AH-259-O06]|nr:hypothetical protein [Acidobacteria bacterium AH-259-O06]